MAFKLKENPSEWFKFTASSASALGLLTGLLWWRHRIPPGIACGAVAVLATVVGLAWFRPRVFRGVYRSGMTLSHAVGQVMGKVLLALMFCAVLTPLALGLRWFGKDLLRLRRDRTATSYWRKARAASRLDRSY